MSNAFNHGRNARMDADGATRCLTRLCQLTSAELLVSLWPVVLRIARLVHQFTSQTASSKELFEFETNLQRPLCELGRRIVVHPAEAYCGEKNPRFRTRRISARTTTKGAAPCRLCPRIDPQRQGERVDARATTEGARRNLLVQHNLRQ